MGFSLSTAIDNFASSMATNVNSYIYQGSSMARVHKNLPLQPTNYESYYDFLKNYHFIAGILDLISSLLNEAINKTDFVVAIDKYSVDDKILKSVNDTISKINLKSQILDDLNSYVYRGSYFYTIDHDDKKLYPVLDPYYFRIVKKGTDVVGYLYKNKFYKITDAVAYWYKIDESVGITRSKSKKIKYENKSSRVLKSFEVAFTTSTVKSIFRDQLDKLYQCYIMEYMLFYLALRESIKPYILSMNYQGTRTDISQAAMASDRIESLLNQPSTLMGTIIDPIAFVNTISYTLFNNIKVVPNVDHFNNISELQQVDFTNIRDRLSRELDNSKREVLSNLGIPEELFNGNSNKWEMLARNDKFMNMINLQLTSISRFVKTVALSGFEAYGLDLSIDDIKFNISIDSFISVYQNRSRMSMLTDKLSDTLRLLDMLKQLMENPAIDTDKLVKYASKQLASSDSGISDVINLNNLATFINKDRLNNLGDFPPGDQYGR